MLEEKLGPFIIAADGLDQVVEKMGEGAAFVVAGSGAKQDGAEAGHGVGDALVGSFGVERPE